MLEKENLNEPQKPQLNIGAVSGSYTIVCNKCKSIEDTFEKDENPEDFGWFPNRKKWYCPACSHNYR